MAELAYTDVPVHVLRDAEAGLLHFMAEVEGALVPIATKKIGHVEAAIEAASVMSVKAPGYKAPAKSKTG